MLRRPLQISTSALSALVLTTGGLALTPSSASAAVSTPAAVLIDEVYGGGGNSGAPFRHDFVELRNTGTAPVDLSSWSVQYASAAGTTWGTAPLTGTLAPDTSYVVRLAAGASTTAPEVTGDTTGGLALSSSAGKVALVSSRAALTCGADCDSAPGVVDFVGYGTAGDFRTAPAPGTSNSTSVARVRHADSRDNSADFVAGTPTPCRGACPAGPVDAGTRTIAEIQGTGTASPIAGSTVTTSGVVTAAYPSGGFSGFYLQTAGTGGPADLTAPRASSGIFVFTPGGTVPAEATVGAAVQVRGRVSEFNGLTEITVAPQDVEVLPGTPQAVTASTTDGWPATPAQRESLEGMLYRPTGAFTVTNTFTTGQFGEVGLAAGTTPLVQPTEVARPGSPQAAAVAADNAARAVTLDDGSSVDFSRNIAGTTRTPAYVSQEEPVVVGAPVHFTDDVVVDFRNGAWKLQPTSTVVGPENTASPATFTNPRTARPDATRIGTAAQVRLASFNVLNYFTTLGTDDPSCTPFVDRTGNGTTVSGGCDQRGAWDADDLARQQSKIVQAINALDASVVGLLEIENSARLGEPTDEALETLVAALNADAGRSVWEANPSSLELPPAAGQDVITNAIIYKPSEVTRFGAARALGDQSEDGQAFANAREPIGQVFTPKRGGDPFLFVVNHFKSKGSAGPWPGDADTGDGQGASNESRVRQARALRDWVPTALRKGVKAVALVGDFNAYTQEDPLQVLYEAGYVDAETAFGGGGEWSYSFSGLSGSLDHVLLNGVARGRTTGADVWNINSGESLSLEYSRAGYSATDFHRPDPYRSSDHDPVVVGMLAQSAPLPVQVLATNDFHGRLVPGGAEAGAAVLAGAVGQLRAAQPNTVFAAAGDLIGASTFESFISKDKPTIDALNRAGLEVSAVGNHEFDQGYADLVGRVMAPYDAATNPQGGATWQYLGANVRRSDGSPALPETWTQDFDGITVGFVGAVTEHLPELVSPTGISGLRVEPVVRHADRQAAALKAAGADVVVLLVHEGAATTALSSATDPGSDFGRIVNGVGPDVDAIVSGHTHLAYDHRVPVPAWVKQRRAVTVRPVVSAGQYGTHLNQLLYTFDPESERLLGLTTNVLPLVKDPAYPSDAATAKVVAKAVADATTLGAATIGTATGALTRAKLASGADNRGGESTLGNLVAEVQRAATSAPSAGGAQIAFMNPGGLRADLTTGSTFPADLTYRQAGNVQPFANTLVNLTLTGAQVRAVLEQQWQPAGAPRPFLRLGISKGFRYTYDPTAPAGSRIRTMELDGTPVTPTATYSVTANSFLAGGGDSFTAFAAGTDRRDTGQVDLQAMVDHLAEEGSVSPDPRQVSVGVALPAGAPASYAPGSTLSFALSSLAFSGPADAKDSAVRISIGGTPVGDVPVDSTVGSEVTDEVGRAQVSVAVPAGTPVGPATVTVTGLQTGTSASFPVQIG